MSFPLAPLSPARTQSSHFPSSCPPSLLAHLSECFPDPSRFFPKHPCPGLLQHSGQLLAGLRLLLGTPDGPCQDTGPERLPASKLNTLPSPMGQFLFSLNFPSPRRPHEVILYRPLIYSVCGSISDQILTSSFPSCQNYPPPFPFTNRPLGCLQSLSFYHSILGTGSQG